MRSPHDTDCRSSRDELGTRPAPTCYRCGAEGVRLYQSLRDRLYATPGVWNLKRCPTAECQLIWLDPTPLAEDLWKAYQTYFTHSDPALPNLPLFPLMKIALDAYLQTRFGYTQGVGSSWYRYLSPLATVLLNLVPGLRDAADDSVCFLDAPEPGARLLEVGFGDGLQLERMRALGWQVSGTELDTTAVDRARARSLDVRLGELHTQAFPASSFDAVYASHVVEHVHDPLKLLRECFRILKPGGTVILITPNAASSGHRTFGRHWVHLDPPRHLFLFTTRTLRTLAEEAGFSVTKLFSTPRLAAISWSYSAEIRRNGRVENFRRPAPLGRKLVAISFQFIQGAQMLTRKQAGEELVVIAKKPSTLGAHASDRTAASGGG